MNYILYRWRKSDTLIPSFLHQEMSSIKTALSLLFYTNETQTLGANIDFPDFEIFWFPADFNNTVYKE